VTLNSYGFDHTCAVLVKFQMASGFDPVHVKSAAEELHAVDFGGDCLYSYFSAAYFDAAFGKYKTISGFLGFDFNNRAATLKARGPQNPPVGCKHSFHCQTPLLQAGTKLALLHSFVK